MFIPTPINTMKKMGVFELGLQLHFLVVMKGCNSLYKCAISYTGQVALVERVQLVVYNHCIWGQKHMQLNATTLYLEHQSDT
jgi:hypothetical protein